MQMGSVKCKYQEGDRVLKLGGSYQAEGTILAAFITRYGEPCYVFDFDFPPGVLHISTEGQLVPVTAADSEPPPKRRAYEISS